MSATKLTTTNQFLKEIGKEVSGFFADRFVAAAAVRIDDRPGQWTVQKPKTVTVQGGHAATRTTDTVQNRRATVAQI